MALIYWRESTNIKERETSQTWPFPVSLYSPADPDAPPDQGGTGNPIGPDNPWPVTVLGATVNAPARRVVSNWFAATAAGDYTAGDVVSNSATADTGVTLQFPAVVDIAGQTAILDKIVIKCNEDSILSRFALDFYAASPLPAEVEMDDNAAFDAAKTVAGYNKYVGRVVTSAMADMGTAMSMCSTGNLREFLRTGAALKDLWVNFIFLDAEANETAGMLVNVDLYYLN